MRIGEEGETVNLSFRVSLLCKINLGGRNISRNAGLSHLFFLNDPRSKREIDDDDETAWKLQRLRSSESSV